jgi:uncharacterized Zn finger protein
MADIPSDPSNPSSPSRPKRPRRPFTPRSGNHPVGNGEKSTPNLPRAGQTQNSRRNQTPANSSTTGNNRTRTDERNKNPNNVGNAKGQNRHFPVNPNRRKPYDRRGNPNSHIEDIPQRPPSIPLKAVGGIKALAENGQFGRNWWARRWIKAMEQLMDGRRLSRGQDYASQGQVLSMGEIKNGVAATVQGSRVKPYRVTIQVMPLKAEEWERALEVLASQAVFAAKLLAGEMPENIEDAFQSAKLSLFPERPGDLVTQCSCPDWANPCKHVAAAHYILGDRFDEDPFLLFRMRGRSQDQVLDGLRIHRGGIAEDPTTQSVEEIIQPLDEDFERFWDSGDMLSIFSVQINPPKISLPILRRLGQPEIIRTFQLDDELGPAYQVASETAMLLAYSDSASPGDETTSELEEDE